jgi:malate dehydrogenase (oxaloacetate-decarboxylating)(NADP+)
VFDRARERPMRVAFAEGETENVLRAVQIMLDDGIVKPILIGRRSVIERRIEKYGLRLALDKEVEVVDPQNDPRYRKYWSLYHDIMRRKGATIEDARTIVRTRTAVIGSLAVRRGDADALICGVAGRYDRHLQDLTDILGIKKGVESPSAIQLLVLPRGTVFVTDTNVNYDPTADQIAESAILAAEMVERFGITPKAALVSHSNFGASSAPSARKMREALAVIKKRSPQLEIDGEMNADAALSGAIRDKLMPGADLSGSANLLIMPNIDSAAIAFAMARTMGEGLSVGPILAGMAGPAHIVNPSITVRGLVNMAALAVVDAQALADARK